MLISPTVRLWLIVLFGSAWSAALIIAGLALLDRGPVELMQARLSHPERLLTPLKLGGVCFFCAGLWVFSYSVADRLFPRADPRVTGMVAGLAGLIFASTLALAVVWTLVAYR